MGALPDAIGRYANIWHGRNHLQTDSVARQLIPLQYLYRMLAHQSIHLLLSLLAVFDAEALIRYGGLPLICLILFAGNALFLLFFIPTGAFLFTGGVFMATGVLPYNVFAICGLLGLVSLLGSLTGYWFGKKTGPALYRRKDSRFFRVQYLKAAEEFYDKRGKLTLIAAPFLPIIRTFAPIIAGMISMPLRKFILPALAGSVLWVSGIVLAGYLIGSWPALKPVLNYVVAGIIVCVTVPVVLRIIKGLRDWQRKERETL